MKLRTLFYGLTHEHSPGKLETLKRLRDTYEIVAIVDDRAATPCFFQTDPPALPEGVTVVGEGCDLWRYISAYGTAVRCGFEGTPQEWLASLVGGDGMSGTVGFPQHFFVR